MYWTSIICNSYRPWTIQHIQPFMISLQDKRNGCKISATSNDSKIISTDTSVHLSKDAHLPKRMTVQRTQDPLFWTLFLLKHGETEYRRGLKNLNTEMNEKKKVADHFHQLGSEKATLDLSIKVSQKRCNKIVEDIITQPKLLLSSIYAFCHYYNLNIYIVNMQKKTYVEFLLDKPEKFENVILYRKQNKKIPEYFVDIPSSTTTSETQAQTLSHIKETLLGLVSFEKSLKSVSNYKLSELQHIYTKLGMTDAPKKKNELYEKIVVHCVWE